MWYNHHKRCPINPHGWWRQVGAAFKGVDEKIVLDHIRAD
jgi:hypothetical protein